MRVVVVVPDDMYKAQVGNRESNMIKRWYLVQLDPIGHGFKGTQGSITFGTVPTFAKVLVSKGPRR